MSKIIQHIRLILTNIIFFCFLVVFLGFILKLLEAKMVFVPTIIKVIEPFTTLFLLPAIFIYEFTNAFITIPETLSITGFTVDVLYIIGGLFYLLLYAIIDSSFRAVARKLDIKDLLDKKK